VVTAPRDARRSDIDGPEAVMALREGGPSPRPGGLARREGAVGSGAMPAEKVIRGGNGALNERDINENLCPMNDLKMD
jgi:hypothetical protein